MNSLIAFLFSNLVIFLIFATIAAFDGGNETDYQALLKFKSIIRNEEALSSWNTSFHLCDWSGVICGKRHRRVTALLLKSQGLEGSLSPHVGNLSFLHLISLTNNSLQGTIPHELGRLSRLRFLYLGSNKFNGVIPTNMSHCSNLEDLRLNNNNLVGSIPKGIGFLSKLTYFLFEYNKLTGGIPPGLGNLTSIELFNAATNPLGGNIPHTLGHWKSLTTLYLGLCSLSGTIPHSIFNLSLLTELSFRDNQLTGSLPSALDEMLPHLRYFQLQDNQLTGSLPPSISNCSKLEFLEVRGNGFNGKLRIDFSKLKDIYQINIDDNTYGFGEADDMKFIDTLRNCSRLKRLDLRNCRFKGVLPTSIGNLSDNLSFFIIQENEFYGNLPSSIGNLFGLTGLGLSRNRFTGKSPPPLVSFKCYK
ncbi:receptor kinase-like protein Xa21 [Lactuca sativa]|uniref:receptor kinase-like protein Xa21 n=1 Tax=Lactuca sativa TaxID=4236 RepID=UPI000CD98D7E|nr:receptor kinase-like protein Xa21 [Lactuca sativa]